MALRTLCLLFLTVAAGFAATVKLYLKDGTYQSAREYSVGSDRVRYLSTERGEWEELPLELVDLARTKKESAALEESRKSEVVAIDAEDRAEREQRREVERIPYEAGVYQTEGEAVKIVKQAEVNVVNNKRRSILKAITPVPVVAGKSSVQVEGVQSAYAVTADRPTFYIRQAAEERMALLRLKPLKTSREVEIWQIIPVSKEIVQEQEVIETFKQQLAEGLFKMWPTKPLTPGEYAIVQYTEGKANTQVWDFGVRGK